MEKQWVQAILNNVAEAEPVYRSKINASERPRLTSAKDAADWQSLLREDGKMEWLEQFKVLFLNPADTVLRLCNLSSGGITLPTKGCCGLF